jgi:hypothetical protein
MTTAAAIAAALREIRMMIRLLVLVAGHDWCMAMPGEKSETKRQRQSARVPLLVTRQFQHRTVRHPPALAIPL